MVLPLRKADDKHALHSHVLNRGMNIAVAYGAISGALSIQQIRPRTRGYRETP